MYFDEIRIESATLGSARERISAIFSDYHVFVGISGWFSNIDQRKAQDLIHDMGLVNYVQVSKDGFSTSALSDGQRRRLALIAALLDERPIYVFDEWAADQDPGFKETFYRKVLPSLRSENKIVLVISHDDRYFECADQLVHMENGKVAEITRIHHAQAPDLPPFAELACR
jgi:putative ATP-binding cassette transporter